MADTVFCRSCGEPLPADSRFCEHCGSEQDDPRPATPLLDPNLPGLERVESFAPGTTALAAQIAAQLQTPTMATALIGGTLAAAGTLVVGLILGLVLPDHSLLGLVDQGKGVVSAGFAQMLNFAQVGYSGGLGKLGPALFTVFPIGACAIAAAAQARRTLGLAPLTRLLSGAGVGVVFGLWMLVPALGAGDLGGGQSTIGPDVLGAVLLGGLWGVIGGVLGTYYVLRTALKPGFLAGLLPPLPREVARTVYVALRPLALLLALMAVVGTIAWTVETLLKSEFRDGESTPVATIDNAAYAIEHGVQWTELAGLSQFQLGGEAALGGVPVPVGDIGAIKANSTGSYRVFGLIHALPAYTAIPLLIFLLVSALLLALSAGFALAQLRQADTPAIAAAWGCLAGPIWALAMLIVNALTAKYLFGRADGGSVFGTFLLGGLVVGALGGLVSIQSQRGRIPGVSGLSGTSGGGTGAQ